MVNLDLEADKKKLGIITGKGFHGPNDGAQGESRCEPSDYPSWSSPHETAKFHADLLENTSTSNST
ncbi:hypothetical protein CR513_26884, partial [Mucuna pruriens]